MASDVPRPVVVASQAVQQMHSSLRPKTRLPLEEETSTGKTDKDQDKDHSSPSNK